MTKTQLKTVEYSIEHQTTAGDWVEEGVYCDTYAEALEELKLCPGQPKEKYRMIGNHYTIRWGRNN